MIITDHSLSRVFLRTLVHAMVIGLAGIMLACGAPRGSSSSSSSEPESTPTASFSIESVQVGIGFDEQVLVDDSPRSTQSARVVLAPEGGDDLFRGAVRAEDAAGNATQIQLEVTVEVGAELAVE